MRIYVNEIKVTEDSINCYTEASTEGLQEVDKCLLTVIIIVLRIF